jgi:hypothetical protein
LPSRSLSFWFIRRLVIDPAQTLAAARPMIGEVLTIVSVTMARRSAITPESLNFLCDAQFLNPDGLRPYTFWGVRYY